MSATDEPCPRHISADGSGLDCTHWQSKPPMDQVHYSHVIMGAMASQITSLTIVYSTVYSGADQRRHQSPAFDKMVLSAATVSRLPWRCDVTISLSRIASNITVPNFCYNNMFYSVTKVLWYFGQYSSLSRNVINATYISVYAELPKLPWKGNNHGFQLRFVNDMWLNVLKCVGVGIIENGTVLGLCFWDLVCKFQSTFVTITDFLCWEIYISIFIYQFLISWICYNILHEIFTWFQSTRDKWLLFLIHFPLALFTERAFLKKNSGRFIYYCILHITL